MRAHGMAYCSSWKWSTGHYLHYPTRAIIHTLQRPEGCAGLPNQNKDVFQCKWSREGSQTMTNIQ